MNDPTQQEPPCPHLRQNTKTHKCLDCGESVERRGCPTCGADLLCCPECKTKYVNGSGYCAACDTFTGPSDLGLRRAEAASHTEQAQATGAVMIGEPIPFAQEVSSLLNECAYTISSLAEQQAMRDDFYERTLAKIEPMLKRLAVPGEDEKCAGCGHDPSLIDPVTGRCQHKTNRLYCEHQCRPFPVRDVEIKAASRPAALAARRAAETILLMHSEGVTDATWDKEVSIVAAIIESELTEGVNHRGTK